MAESSMLSLFESEADFLDDLTGGANVPPAAQGTMAGMQAPMGPRMPQNTPPQYTPLGGGQKLPHYNSQYDQFAQQQKFSGMTDGRQASISQMLNTSPQQPFGSPPPTQGARMQSPGPNFQGYGMHGNTQQVTPPQQGQPRAQMGMSPGPGSMWNQGNSMQQGNKAMPGQVPYVQQQQQQPSSQPLQGYMSHHDYNSLSTSHPAAQAASQMNRFPTQQSRQMYGRPPMGSPPPSAPQRMSHMPISNQANMDPSAPSQFPVNSQAGMLRGQGTAGMLSNMNNYPSNAQPQGMMPGGNMQGMQMSSNAPAYPYGGPQGQIPQQTGLQAQQQAALQTASQAGLPRVGQVPSNGPMSPYQSQSSGQNAYRQPFPGMPQQQGGIRHPMQSSQPLAPTSQQMPPISGSSAQGFNTQPGISHQPFSSYGASYNINRTSGSLSQPSPVSGIMGMSSNSNSGIVTSASSAPVVSAPLAVVTGNVPNQPSQSMTPNMQALDMEIQQLQGQVQQLYQMPQTPETQQKMLDLQERARSLRGQQQTQLLLQQRSQQQQTSQMMSPGGQSSVGVPSVGSINSVPVRQPTPNMMMQQLSPMPAAQVRPIAPAPAKQLSPSIPQQAPSMQSMQLPMQPITEMSRVAGTPTPPPPQLSSVDSELGLFSTIEQAPSSIPSQSDQQEFNSQPVTPVMFAPMLDDYPGAGIPLLPGIPGESNPFDKAQDKAQKIMEEAIAKAKAEGRDIPTMVSDDMVLVDEDSKAKKKKKPRKKKENQEDKPPKEKKERKPKKPKDPNKSPKPKKSKGKKDVEVKASPDGEGGVEGEKLLPEGVEGELVADIKPKPEKKKSIRPSRPKKKKPPATFLKKIKKRKRNESSGSEVEMGGSATVGVPPGSPLDDDKIEKRRSGRVTKRKKYLDDIDLNLSEEDTPKKGDQGGNPILQPVQFFVDNPAEEEAQIVEKILGNRIAMRKFKKIVEVPVQEVKVEVAAEPTTDVDIMGSPMEDTTATNGSMESSEIQEDINPTPAPSASIMEETDTTTSISQNTEEQIVTVPIQPLTEQDEDTHEKDLPEDVAPETNTEVKPVEQPEDPDEYEELEVEEFFVKYKNFSYLHCEWRTADELELGDKRIHQKIKRFKIKKLQSNPLLVNDDDDLFNMDYTEVDRILDVSHSTDPVSRETVTHYLVKWCCLAYEDSTWELANDVDVKKIEAFTRYREPPSEEEREYKPRPKASQWKQLDETPEYKNDNLLREYQLEGINWLTFCWYNKQNCILADEMGLGKTIQSITFLQEIVNYGIRGPFLVIVPLSTIANWQREFERWTDLNAIVYHGSSPSRTMIQEYEMYYKDEDGRKIPDLYRFHALITTYEMVISDMEMLTSIDWRATIIDEAHRLKNKKCRLAEGLKLFDLEHRVLLTGTPLQNNVEELFALLNFLEPQRFNSTESFLAEFGDLKTESQVDKLKALLKPMMLRRLKEDVEKNLAPKEETIIEVELTNIQKKYYRAILERNFTFLSKGTGSMTNVPNLMNTMMELRKCCNHPYLVKGAEEKIQDDMKPQHVNMHHIESTFHAMVHSCGKLVLLDKLLPKLKANGHKVLLFSQMIRVLDILEDYLIHRQYLYERLDGRIRGNVRQEAIDRFSKPDSDRFVFLLCTRAGGLGINLTAADTVIIYDSDWNPQNDLQAQARCHRIGQKKMVKVYRLITRNSYEREMFDKASLKLGLDKAVLQGAKENGNPQQQMSKKEVEDLLKKGAYGALMDDDTSGDQFCEEDIDQILQRRTQVIQIESEGKGSMFAKASFNMSSNRTDIDIDDPNFWQKWATKADLDADYLTNRNDLIIEQPRVRKQTSRFGGQDAALEISDLESSDSGDDDGTGQGKGKKGKGSRSKKARSREEDFEPGEEISGCYLRAECFKVEKHLLVYGWGRWDDILLHGRFKRKMESKDIIIITKAMLLYSLLNYHGDERIKGFIWDLVNAEEGAEMDYRNHSGLSAPVPRGRKGKKKQKEQTPQDDLDFSKCDIDPNEVLVDEGYKKHLKRHANKVLLRVRLLYYLKQEIIADQAEKIFSNYHANDIDIPPPCPDGDPPMYWWDEEADKSILIGVFKHGYEKYNIMRQDPMLCFLDRCGPPDSAALLKEQNDEDNPRDDMDDEPQTATPKRRRGRPPLDDDYDMYMDSSPAPSSKAPTPQQIGYDGKLPFPGASELNTRLRRVITGYQRNYKKQQLKDAQKAKKMERRKNIDAAVKEREYMRRSQQQSRWSRREEADFYRVVSTFGVERDRKTRQYNWDTFRSIARLDKKYDDTLTEYYLCFYHMCKRVSKKFKTEEEAIPPSTLYVEPITEERATRSLARIDLLNKVREYILWHPKLKERLKLCQPSYDMPEWWVPGDHDLDLLIGAAKHGLARTDINVLHDPKLCFKELVKMKAEELSSMYRGLRSNTSGTDPETPTKNDNRLEDENEPEPGEVVRESPLKKESPRHTDLVKKDTTTKDENFKHSPSKTPEQKSELSHTETHEQSSSSPSDISLKTEDKQVTDELEQGEIIVSQIKQEIVSEEFSTSIKPEPEDSITVKTEPDVVNEVDVKTENSVENLCVKSESNELNGEPPETREEVEQDEEKIQAKFERTGVFPDMESGFMEPEPGEITSSDMMARAMGNPAVQWPKDRVIYHRLENVCHCIEQGEWPFPRRPPSTHPLYMTDSRASTPNGTPSGTPKPEAGDRSETPDSGLDRATVKQADGLKMTFHKKKGRRRKKDMEPEGGRLSELVNMPSDCDSESNMSGLQSETDMVPNGATFPYSGLSPRQKLEEQMERMQQQLQLQQIQQIQQLQAAQSVSPAGVMDMMPKKRRGRKRKVEKQLEEQAAALMAAQQAHKEATMQPESDLDAHVPVVSLEDGHRLSGEDAPTRRELALWLEQNPKYIVERSIETGDDEYEPGMIRGHKKHRRPRVDPYKLDLDSLTGEENVSVMNKETGKKITGAKAPPLKYLKQWLEQNPTFNVDPKWAHVVRAMGNFSEEMMKDRVPEPHGRRGRRSESSNMSSMMADYTNYAAAAGMGAFSGLNPLMPGFPKIPFPMGYGGLAGLNLASMYGLGSGFGMVPGALPSKSGEESEEKEAGETEDSSSPSKSKASSSSSSTTPHPSFPFMYNPMMFNPLLAQSMGSFSLPSTLPTSFATLAQAGSSGVNGVEDSDADNVEQSEPTDLTEQQQEVAQDLSVKKSPPSKLSMPRKVRKHKHPMKIEYSKSNTETLDEPMNLSSKPSPKASKSRESPLDEHLEQAAIDSDVS